MKKIILGIVLCLICSGGVYVLATDYRDVEKYEVEVEEGTLSIGENVLNDKNRNIFIKRDGNHPFVTYYGEIGFEHYVENYLITETGYYIVGYYHNNEILDYDNYYDSFVMKISTYDGSLLWFNTYDGGFLDEMEDIIAVDDKIAVLNKESIHGEREVDFFTNKILLYNVAGELEIEQNIKVEAKSFCSTGDIVYISKYHDCQFHYGITTNGDIVNNKYFSGIEDGEEYEGDVMITHLGTVTLNGVSYRSGDKITMPGEYEVLYINTYGVSEDYTFSLLPVIHGVKDNGMYYDDVSITVSGGNVYLNNELVEKKITVSELGTYELRIEGIDGYAQCINFSIIEPVIGVEDGSLYQEPVIPYFELTAFLNGESFSSGTEIEKNGNYVLELYDEYDLVDTVDFTISLDEKEEFVFSYFDVVIIAGCIFCVVLIFKKK